MGVPAPVPKGVRKPSHVAYYVALVGILALLIMLCLYFFYYFIKKVKELSSAESLSVAPSRPPPAAYPVQPVVREGATAMARLCKQVPAGGKGGTVFPTSSSPAALRASTGEGAQEEPAPPEPPVEDPRPDPEPLAKPPPVPLVCVSAAPDLPAR